MSLGIDLSLEMLREARRRGCEVVQADMALPLPLRTGGGRTANRGSACRGGVACQRGLVAWSHGRMLSREARA